MAACAALMVLFACGRDQTRSRLVDRPVKPEAGDVPAFTGPVPSFDPNEAARAIPHVRALSFPAEDNHQLNGYIFGDEGNRSRGVVLAHSSDRNMAMWYPLAERMMRAGYAVVVFDFRGYGMSLGPRSAAKGPSDIAGALNALYLHGVNHFAIVGAEFGGTAAFPAVSTWGRQVDAVIAIGAPVRFDSLDATSGARNFLGKTLFIGDSDLSRHVRNGTTKHTTQSPNSASRGPLPDDILDFLSKNVR